MDPESTAKSGCEVAGESHAGTGATSGAEATSAGISISGTDVNVEDGSGETTGGPAATGTENSTGADISVPSKSLKAETVAMWSGTSTVGCTVFSSSSSAVGAGAAATAAGDELPGPCTANSLKSGARSSRMVCCTKGGIAAEPTRSSSSFTMASRSLASNGLMITPSALTRLASSGL